MKKMMKLLTVVAVAAMGLTACQNSFEEVVNGGEISKPTITVNFVADEARTAVDTSGDTPLFSWNDSESFAVLEQTDALAKASSVTFQKVDGKASIDAEFALNAGKDEYKYVAVHPASGFISAEKISEATLALPSEQSAVAGSYDPNADLMVSEVVTTAAQPTEAQQLRFTRLAAVVKMSVKNLTIGAGETIEKVEFTANGKSLAGRRITADLEDPRSFSVAQSSSSVSVATSSADEVYFTVLPATLVAGDTYNVVVATDKKIYIKEGEIPAGKSLVFESGMVSRFSVNMTDAIVADRWELVRDASTLAEGDVVAIVSNQYNYILGANKATNYPYASKTEVVKCGSFFRYTPADATKDNMIQLLTIAKRDGSRNAFDFYNAANEYEGDTDSGFLCAPGTGSKHLKLLSYYSAETQFDVTIDNGIAAIIATNSVGSSKQMMYNHNASYATSRFFCCYSSTDDAAKAVCIYRLVGAKRTIPTVEAHITVPENDEKVIISEDATQAATAIDEVIFDYVGDWNIEVSDNADWLTVAYNAEKITYTAEANTDTSAARSATVTITASRGEETLDPWTFTIEQKRAAVEISIADFKTKGKDLDTTYKLTGIIAEIPNSATGKFMIEDENGTQVQVSYLKTETGADVKGNIDIKVGDVISLTTIVAGTTAGVGGNSSNHSIYKGHYHLSVSAGIAADYTGGAVAIEVATSHNGSIELPTTPVSGTMAPCDYATFAYTDGAASATVSFTSENTTSGAREATATFTYGLASASVTVQQGINPANKIGYELVTDASTLAVGDEVIIVARNKDKALGVSSSTITSQSNFPAVDIAKTGNTIYDADKAGVQPFTLVSGNSAGKFGFQFTHKDVDYYLYVYSTSGLRGRKVSDGLNDRTSYTITIDSTSGSATILESVNTRYVKFNGTSGTTFVNTSATNAAKESYDVCIYKKEVK